MFSSRTLSLVAAVAVVLLGGCTPRTTTAETGTAASDEIPVTVFHNKLELGRIGVWIAADLGLKTLLGNLEPGQTRTFYHKVGTSGRRIQLQAESATGERVTTTPLNIPPGSSAFWDVQLNLFRQRR
jgi:hypothetical protein